jgi:hypothetical protein
MWNRPFVHINLHKTVNVKLNLECRILGFQVVGTDTASSILGHVVCVCVFLNLGVNVVKGGR